MQVNTTMNKLDEIREQFPITRECFINAHGVRHAITYLDHGASTHPSSVVLDTYREFLERYYADIHRGNHFLSQKASQLFEAVSDVDLGLVGADSAHNGVVFTSN